MCTARNTVPCARYTVPGYEYRPIPRLQYCLFFTHALQWQSRSRGKPQRTMGTHRSPFISSFSLLYNSSSCVSAAYLTPQPVRSLPNMKSGPAYCMPPLRSVVGAAHAVGRAIGSNRPAYLHSPSHSRCGAHSKFGPSTIASTGQASWQKPQ